MQEIALIGDIHGNRAALEAVDADLQKRGIDICYCLGDIVGKGPDDDEALQYVRTHCTGAIQGNWDTYVLHPQPDFTLSLWHATHLNADQRMWLSALPLRITLCLGQFRVMLVHGRPVYHKVIFTEETPEQELEHFFSAACGGDQHIDAVAFADSHRQGLVPLLGGRQLFNIGSVGNSLKGNTRACYCVLHLYEHGIGIEFVQLTYDRSSAIRRAYDYADMPERDAYIHELQTGLYSR